MREPPFAAWSEVAAYLEQEWLGGDHVTLIGPTGSGKTHLALGLAESAPYALALATKRKDPLLERLAASGWQIIPSLKELRFKEGRPEFRRYVFWPARTVQGLDRRRAAQAAALREALDFVDQAGHWALLVDETLWLTRALRLERELEALWFQGRTQGVSVIACAQRPAHIPRLAYSQCRFLFLWRTGDGRDLDNLAEISSGIPRQLIERSVARLDPDAHEVLFLDAERRVLARTIAPPRPLRAPARAAAQ